MIARIHSGAAEIDSEQVGHRMSELEVPGLSAVVVVDGDVTDVYAWGVRRLGSPDPIDAGTLFQAGSISKPVAALGALHLVAKGVLELDRDLNDYLRSWRIPEVKGWQPRVTLRNVLCHAGGFTVHGFPGYTRSGARPSVVQILDGSEPANTAAVRVDIIPGLQPRYSGGGYTVMQLVLEDVTGTPFPELMKEFVLDPAGMTTATYDQPLPASLHEHASSGHERGEVVHGGWHVYPEMAAAGLWCTPADLARFAIALQRAHQAEPDALLPPALAGEMLTVQVPGWGLGVQLGGEEPDRRFGHGGKNEGFLASLLATVDGGYAVAGMANSGTAGLLLAELQDSVASVWPGYEMKPPLDVPATIARFVGAYRSDEGLRIAVEARPDGLALIIDEQPPLALDFISLGEWMVRALRADVSFDVPEEGQVTGLTIRQWGSTVRAERTSKSDR